MKQCSVLKDQLIVSCEQMQQNRLVCPPVVNVRGVRLSSHRTSAEVKNEWSYASALPIRGHGVKWAKDIHLFMHFSPPFKFILLNLICMEHGIATRPRTGRTWNHGSIPGQGMIHFPCTLRVRRLPSSTSIGIGYFRQIADCASLKSTAVWVNYSEDAAVIFGCLGAQEHGKCCHLPGQRRTI